MIKLSRSKIDLYVKCPRCFWLDVRGKIKRPPPAPYTINNAVDYLLKQEFDKYREEQSPHPIMEHNDLNVVPFSHPDIDRWRHNFTGVQFKHDPTGFLVFGAVDDVWATDDEDLFVVDYKATGARQHKIYDSYERQMEIYQWLLRQNGFNVSSRGYFVFARVNKEQGFSGSSSDGARGSLPFDIYLEHYDGDDSWIEEVLKNAREVYDLDVPPEPASDCEYCSYAVKATSEFEVDS